MSRPRRTASPSYNPLHTGSAAPLTGERSLEQVIGAQVRQHRRRLGLTGAELAAAAGLSVGMLSKIETGQISASLGSLQSLSEALGVPLTALLAPYEQRRDCSFVGAGRGVTIERRGSKAGHRYQLLGHSLAGEIVVEPYLITLSTDAVPYASFQHAGTEIIHMLTGVVGYRHGDRTYRLSPGDTLMFDAEALHGPEELVELPMIYLSIIIYPRP
jgi:transcriptional regulator with XRE-family HTH domain